MLLRNTLLPILFTIFLISCKTITISDNSITTEPPESIELILIPAGNYIKGENNEVATMDYDYSIMKHPVTNKQFLTFIMEASELGIVEVSSQSVLGYYEGDENWHPGFYELVDLDDPDCRIGFNPPNEFVIKWRWVENRQEGYDDHPITEVSWFGAKAFANYYGMDLPTKEEWEKAARANTDYKFPWGNDIDSSMVNFLNSGDIYDNDTTPVGHYNGEGNTTLSYSPYGIYDMSGNVWEWTNSWKDQSPGKVIKGGSYQSGSISFQELFTWFEPTYGYSPDNSMENLGFRCTRH